MYCPNCGATISESAPFNIENEYEPIESKPYSPLLLTQIQVRDMRMADLRFFQDKAKAVQNHMESAGIVWEKVRDAKREVMRLWDVFFLLKYGAYDLSCWAGKGTIVNIDPETGQPYDAPSWYEKQAEKARG